MKRNIKNYKEIYAVFMRLRNNKNQHEYEFSIREEKKNDRKNSAG